MKIAVAAMGHTVAGHFGHCENFIFFDVEDNKIVDEKSVPNPGHRPGFLPNFLADNGAAVIIAGGMGCLLYTSYSEDWSPHPLWQFHSSFSQVT